MFILMPTLANCDCTAIAWALLVASRSFDVIAVNEKPSEFPAFCRYALAWSRFGVGQIAETGLVAYGPSGTGPTGLPWPSTALLTTCWRSRAQAIASRLL